MKQLNSHNFEEVYKWLGVNLNTLGCVMLDLEPLSNSWSIAQDGGEINLYYSKDKEKFWIDGWVFDKIPHLTLLYGLLEQAKNFQPHIEKVLKGWKLNEVEIEDIGFFESPYPDEPYYCLIAHIKVTPELMEGHQRLEFLPHINTFAGYKPHITIAYIKKEPELRDIMIKHFQECWKGKKMNVKESLNLGSKS